MILVLKIYITFDKDWGIIFLSPFQGLRNDEIMFQGDAYITYAYGADTHRKCSMEKNLHYLKCYIFQSNSGT